jgi:hypothetical protein
MAWSLGSVIVRHPFLPCLLLPFRTHLFPTQGPLLGGYLSHPSDTYPLSLLFSSSTFFRTYPYALPCLFGALFPLGGAIVGFLFLEETLTPAAAAREEEDERARERERRRHKRFVQTTSTTVPAPERRRLLGEEEEEADSGYSTPARGLSTEGAREGEAEEAVKAPPRFADLFTRRVWAALITYVRFVSLSSCGGNERNG